MKNSKNLANKVLFKTIHRYPLVGQQNHPLNHGFVEAYSRINLIFKDIYLGMMEHSDSRNIEPNMLTDPLNASMRQWINLIQEWGTEKHLLDKQLLSKFRFNHIAGQALTSDSNTYLTKENTIKNLDINGYFEREFQLFIEIITRHPEITEEINTHNGINYVLNSIKRDNLNASFGHWLFWIDFCVDAREFIEAIIPETHQYADIDQLFENLDE